MGTRAFIGCDSKRKGDASEALALWKLSEAGLTVLIPWGDNARFDLVAVIGNTFCAFNARPAACDQAISAFGRSASVATASATAMSLANSTTTRSDAWRQANCTLCHSPRQALQRNRNCASTLRGQTPVAGDKPLAYAGRRATKLTWSSNPGCVRVASSTRAGHHPCSSQLTAGIRIACTGTHFYDLSVNVRPPGALKVSQVCRPHG